MTTTEDQLRQTLTAQVADRTVDSDRLLAGAMGKYRRRRNHGLVASVVVAVTIAAMSVVGVTTFSEDKAAAPRTYPLPTNGATGVGGDLARVSGRLVVRMTAHGACVSLGGYAAAFLWPKGYRVTLDPAQLLDSTGKVVARGGDIIHGGGGGADPRYPNRCAKPGQETFSITNSIGKGP